MPPRKVEIKGETAIKLRPPQGSSHEDFKRKALALASAGEERAKLLAALMVTREKAISRNHPLVTDVVGLIRSLPGDLKTELAFRLTAEEGSLFCYLFQHYLKTYACDLERRANALTSASMLGDLNRRHRQVDPKKAARNEVIFSRVMEALGDPPRRLTKPLLARIRRTLEAEDQIPVSVATVKTVYRRMKDTVTIPGTLQGEDDSLTALEQFAQFLLVVEDSEKPESGSQK
jgi:hypothetical protein